MESVVLKSDTLTITPKTQNSMTGTTEIYTTLMEDESELTQRLEEAGVDKYYKEPPGYDLQYHLQSAEHRASCADHGGPVKLAFPPYELKAEE